MTLRLLEVLLALVVGTAERGPLVHDGMSLPSRGNVGTVAVGAALASTAHGVHDDWWDELRGQWYIDHPSQVTDVYGASSFGLPVSMALWGTSRLAARPALQARGEGLTRTLILTQFVVGPLKYASHRRRPDGSDHYSFPSGHAANTFAIARYLQRDLGTRAALLPYALAVTTALGRMEGGRHYLSDVVMGASLGLVAGSTVAIPRVGDGNGSRMRLVPMVAPASGLRLVLPLR